MRETLLQSAYLRSDLIAALASLDVDDFSHVVGGVTETRLSSAARCCRSTTDDGGKMMQLGVLLAPGSVCICRSPEGSYSRPLPPTKEAKPGCKLSTWGMERVQGAH